MKCSFIISIVTLLFIAFSCATIKDSTINQEIKTSKCNQQNEYLYTEEDFPASLSTKSINSSNLANKISPNSLHIANTIGIMGYLEEYSTLKASASAKVSLEERIHLLELRQEIDHRINIASLIISAVSAELDCEEERVSQIANYIAEKQNSLESKLTISAIVIGATGAILTGGVIKNNKTSNAVGISTGVIEAGLGLTMLFNKRKIAFNHERNILKDIWEGPKTSKLFPSFIWYYLNHENEEQSSLRKEIIAQWQQFGQIENVPNAFSNLYFGEGGKYTSDQLNNRADMYDQLESQIYLLKQKLMTLANEIDKI